jgi:hypothetical protein
VEADGAHAEQTGEGGRQQVLAGVLLHVVEAPRPIDRAVHRRAHPQRRGPGALAGLDEMRDRPVLPSTTSTTRDDRGPVSNG